MNETLPGVNLLNILRTNFSYERCFSSYVLALLKNLYEKTRVYNVDEIDYRCQFHQHFTRVFFEQNLQSFVLALRLLGAKFLYKKLVRKMLMKLAPGLMEKISVATQRVLFLLDCTLFPTEDIQVSITTNFLGEAFEI